MWLRLWGIKKCPRRKGIALFWNEDAHFFHESANFNISNVWEMLQTFLQLPGILDGERAPGGQTLPVFKAVKLRVCLMFPAVILTEI